uniref:DNA topoisomerase (ATP-hydrolyzing) n=2 Tax=Anopheles albimanus TaxID=7167 RepID=A0A182FBX0_ANOAL
EENHEGAEEPLHVPVSGPIDDLALKHAQLRCRINALLQHIEQHVCEGAPLIGRQKLNWDDCTIEEGILQPTVATLEATRGKRIRQQRLQLIVRMLANVHQLLTTGTSCTKRELYYLNLDLVRSPACSYAALADVCALLDVEPWELNVFNTSKGLIAGPLVLTLGSGETIDCGRCRWGTPVPMDVGSVMMLQSTAKAVLIVEKDTVFKRLLEDGLMSKSANSVLLITAKGYPDVSTRLLLRKIVDTLSLPMYALVDADPHGIEILCVYKFGSLAMAHRQQSLAIPSIQWIGLFPSDIELLGLHSIPLRDGELRKIELMIERPYASGLIKKELLLLRQLAVKTEIESLFHIASDFIITVYLKQKLKECVIGN